MKSKWRTWALAVILSLSTAVGFFLHFSSTGSGDSASTDSGPPFLLGVYTSSPSQPIKLDLELHTVSDGTFVDVLMNAPENDRVVFLCSHQDVPEGPLTTSPAFRPIPVLSGSGEDYQYYDLADGSPPFPNDPRGYLVARFKVPNSALAESADEITARLPLVGQGEDDVQSVPEAALTSSGIYLNPALEPGNPPLDSNPAHYTVADPANSPVTDLFWNPTHLTTLEKARGISQKISGWNISTTPADGTSDAGDFVWQGDYGIAGVLTAVNPAAAERRDSDEFYSGIFLATAAAALIALLQECRDELSTRKRKQERGELAPKIGMTNHKADDEKGLHNFVPSGLGWPKIEGPQRPRQLARDVASSLPGGRSLPPARDAALPCSSGRDDPGRADAAHPARGLVRCLLQLQQRVGRLRSLHADSPETVDCIAEELAELTPDG